GEVSQPPIPIIRFDTAGVAGDTLWSSPAPLRDQIVLELGQRRMMVLMSPAFQPPLRWAPLPDGGIVVSDTAEYLLRWVSPEGPVRRIVRRLPPARETTERDREWARERLREESEDGRGPALGGLDPELLLRQRLEKMTFAPLVPRITGLRVDGAGRVWVGVSTDTPEETGRIDVYGPEGELLGELHGLDRVPSLFFGGDRAALLTRDELDVQQLVLVRLREGAGARGE
ncbi:MAG TPA: hypothetical protein VMK65_13205, partial [Longimicrobiales bacterium]|nr:hypothetical protein [Longimicrobiales bacterium]